MSDHKAQPEKQNTAPMQMIFPAHRNTPGGVYEVSFQKKKWLRHEVGFAHEFWA